MKQKLTDDEINALAEDFITKHYEETGHTLFDMDVLAHTICVKVIDAGKEEPCGMN